MPFTQSRIALALHPGYTEFAGTIHTADHMRLPFIVLVVTLSLAETMTRGTPLVELDRSGKWVRIGLAGRRQSGWIYVPLLENGSGR